MGISRLSELIREQAAEAITSKTIHAYEGRVMALDAAVVMNQFRMARPDRRYLNHLSQIVGVFYRTASLLEKGIKPVFVFDGPAPRMKSRVLCKRHGWRPDPETDEHACTGIARSEEHACRTITGSKEHVCRPTARGKEHACTRGTRSEEHACRPVSGSEENACRTVAGNEEHTCRLVSGSEEHTCRPTARGEEHACRPIACREEHACRPVAESEGHTCIPGSRGPAGEVVSESDRRPESEARPESVARNGRRDCQRLLTLLGVPYIEAPGEAEATCAALVKAGKVHCTATEDMDALPFGCTRLVRNVTARKDARVEEFSLPAVLKALELTQEQFVDLCILMGCDYCEKIKGIGLKRAVPLIQNYKSIEGLLRNLEPRRFRAPVDWPFREARRLFLEPEVVDVEEVRLEWGEPDEEGLVQLLVHEKRAKEKRVRSRIRSLRASLREVERRRGKFTPERWRRLDHFYSTVKAFRYRAQQAAEPHFRLSMKRRRAARRNLSGPLLRRRVPTTPRASMPCHPPPSTPPVEPWNLPEPPLA